MKYFKLDKDKREIIIDKYKKYNVNVDILDLIIDLQQEIDRLNNIINELEKYIASEYYCFDNESIEFKIAKNILDKIKELKDSDNNVKDKR